MSANSAKISYSWLMQQARQARYWLALSIILGLLSGLTIIAQAWLIAEIIGQLVFDHIPRNQLAHLFILLLAIMLIRSLLAWGRECFSFRAAKEIKDQVRRNLMAHLYTLGPGYSNEQATGGMTNTLLEQIDALEEFFAKYLPQMALAVLIPVAILVVVMPMNWVSGLILLFTAPMIPLLMALVGAGAAAANRRNFKALARLSGHFFDLVQGLTTLKLLNRSAEQQQQVWQAADHYRQGTLSVLRLAFLSSAVLELFSVIAIAMIAVYLGFSLLGFFDLGTDGLTLTIGLFILLLAPEFYLPLRELGVHYHARAQAISAADRIQQILQQTKPVTTANRQQLPKNQGISLVLDQVQLSYPDTASPALEQISFNVTAGQRLVVVGPSGAGKTSLLKLLLGFAQPTQGQLLVNGVCLTQLDPNYWRQHIAWLGQDPRLFYGSIRSNIAIANPRASAAAIEQAAEFAQVMEFAQHLPEGLDTPIGEQGLGLSCGQAQRIALARACLKQARLWLLDEPTANLDSYSEDLVLTALDKLSPQTTMISVTHRLATIKKDQPVVVLDRGRIVEQGSQSSLLAEKGLYYQLANHYGVLDHG
jgi:ATP-binding cassette subfamily C protein CydD